MKTSQVRGLLLAGVLLCAGARVIAVTDQSQQPCASAAVREFDFWTGDWANGSRAGWTIPQLLDFTGAFEEGQMVLTRDAVEPSGRRVRQRMVWKNITPNSLDWSWERADDGGATWKVLWPVRYQRSKR